MQSVDRIVNILTKLSNSSKGMGITDLYGVCDLPKSTLHRTLNSLTEFGFVVQDAQTKKYRLGPALLRLGTSFLEQNDLRSVARPYIEELSASFNETVYITVLQGDTALCVDTYGASRNFNYFVRIGREMPFNTTAAAKVILAFQSKESIKKILCHNEFNRLTGKSIIDPKELSEHFMKIRAAGYGVCEEEMEEGVAAIAAPIWDWTSQVIGSVAIIGPCIRLSGDIRQEIIEKVKNTASLISREMGYAGNDVLGAPERCKKVIKSEIEKQDN